MKEGVFSVFQKPLQEVHKFLPNMQLANNRIQVNCWRSQKCDYFTMIEGEIQDLVLWAKSSVNKYLHTSICSNDCVCAPKELLFQS